MNRMGSSCSMSRQSEDRFIRRRNGTLLMNGTRSASGSSANGGRVRRCLRHSVVSALPDGSISSLYPVDDNYNNCGDGLRSPKSLAELATAALCRSLAHLDGELPPGLPQDVVNDIVESLIKHSAFNATTLRILKNCELGTLSLAKCRGVTDEWLQPLSTAFQPVPTSPDVVSRSPSKKHRQSDKDLSIDFEDDAKTQHIFYGTLHSNKYEESSCSTSSFVSANSKPCADAAEDHIMSDVLGSTGDILSRNGTPVKELFVHQNSTSPSFPNTSELTMDSTFQACSSPSICDMQRQESLYCNYELNQPSPVNNCVTSNLTVLDLRGSQRLTDRGLLHLTDLVSLEVARLDHCHVLTGRGLLAFSKSHRLHTLSLANCRRLTDEAVINISHLYSLEALSLDGCRCLTNRSLAAMSDLYGLRKLDLSQCDLVTDAGLEELVNLEVLTELSLGWCRQISDRGIDILTGQPGRDHCLCILRLARCSLSDEGVAFLARLLALEELDLNGCSTIGSAALGATLGKLCNLQTLDVSHCPGILQSGFQGKIDKVKSLDLCYAGVENSHLSKLTHLPCLEEINLDSCPVGNWAIAHLADNNVVPNLTSIDLADTDLNDIGMAKLATFKKLTRLSLFYCNISNRGLRHVSELKSLEVLNLDGRDISDDGVRHLTQLKNLKSLDIFSGRITDCGCSHLALITSLETLELCGGGISDLGCTSLARLENLKSLNLSQNDRITNRGAAALAALVNLKMLNLSNTRVNSSALRFFSGLLQLQSLALYGCRGIADCAGLGKLQDELPNLKCLRLNRAFDEDGVVLADNESDDDSDAMWSDNLADAMWSDNIADVSDGDLENDIEIYSDNDSNT